MESLIEKFNGIVESLGPLGVSGLSQAVAENGPRQVDNGAEVNELQMDHLLFSEGLTGPEGLADEEMRIEEEDDEGETSSDESVVDLGKTAQDHIMTTDSYGKLRYVTFQLLSSES
jgi:hypothetical protein